VKDERNKQTSTGGRWRGSLAGLHAGGGRRGNIYDALKNKAKKVNWGGKNRKELYCLFNKKGFTDAMIKKAKEEEVILFKEDVLYQ